MSLCSTVALKKHQSWPTCRGQGLLLKAKAKDLTIKAQAKAKDLTFKDSKFVLEDTSRPRTKAKDNNTASRDTSALPFGV